jgi:N,N'-diacetyllegionaminate synthase
VIVSTGAATFEEVMTACEWLRGWGTSFALMHCVSAYPVQDADANLCWIGELASAAGAPVGFSDHTVGEATGAVAVAAGACMIEKHLTYDKTAKGPDHAASSDPSEFARYVRLIRTAEILRGAPGKHVLDCEEDVRTVSRQSLVLARDIADGQAIAEGDLVIQRPGTGIPAAQLGRVVGRRMAAAARKGTMLTWELLANAA